MNDRLPAGLATTGLICGMPAIVMAVIGTVAASAMREEYHQIHRTVPQMGSSVAMRRATRTRPKDAVFEM